MKPDIVFFGESLPERFFQLAPEDFGQADLLIVMGTSLVVQPFASLIGRACEAVPGEACNDVGYKRVPSQAVPSLTLRNGKW